MWTAEGVALESTSSLSGGPDILKSSWLSQILNVLALYLSTIHSLKSSRGFLELQGKAGLLVHLVVLHV